MSSRSRDTDRVVGWRIVKAKHADGAFTGEGARLYGGRWNPAGVPAVYLSEHQSLGALEILVHMHPIAPKDQFRLFRVEWNPALMETVETNALPADWKAEPASAGSRNFGARWARESRSAVLSVPSAILPGERNFVLNPAHPHFPRIRIDDAIEFAFDHRLLSR